MKVTLRELVLRAGGSCSFRVWIHQRKWVCGRHFFRHSCARRLQCLSTGRLLPRTPSLDDSGLSSVSTLFCGNLPLTLVFLYKDTRNFWRLCGLRSWLWGHTLQVWILFQLLTNHFSLFWSSWLNFFSSFLLYFLHICSFPDALNFRWLLQVLGLSPPAKVGLWSTLLQVEFYP